VYVVLGPAGSGKSTVGKRIARRHRAAYLDKDGLVTGFTELLLETMGFARSDRDHNAYYLSTLMPLEYETLLRVCGDNLAVGSSVVLDAPFGRYFADENYLLDAAARHGWPAADLVVVHVSLEGPAPLDRLVRRSNPGTSGRSLTGRSSGRRRGHSRVSGPAPGTSPSATPVTSRIWPCLAIQRRISRLTDRGRDDR
jgi:predicted kinase